jgi:hypothetical protein
MSDVICKRLMIRNGSINAVREWARTISARRSEALETLRDEGVQLESVFLERLPDRDYLLYYMRGVDLAGSRQVARESKHPIDEYHQRVMKEHIESGTELEILVDLEMASERS